MKTQTQLLFPDLYREDVKPQPRATARRSDPDTSHQAAVGIEASGKAGTQRAAVLECVRCDPGQTSAEIAVAAGLERAIPSRRLPELERAGLIRKGDARLCYINQTRMVTWHPVE